MPITPEMMERLDGAWAPMPPGEASVMSGHQSSMIWRESRIPLDGRTYICAGKVILRSGQELPANFRIQTDLCFLLNQESVTCRLGTTWYGMHEPELYIALGIPKEQAVPYYWLPDRPLDCEDKGPYRMDWGFLRKRELAKQIKPSSAKVSLRSSVLDHPALAYVICLVIYSLLLRWVTNWSFNAITLVAVAATFITLAAVGWIALRRARQTFSTHQGSRSRE